MACCNAKGTEYFNQYLYDNLSHRWVGRDLGVNIEASKKVFDRLEEIDKGVVTRANILYRLWPPMSHNLGED
jgi:hypothetical protein